MQTGPSNTAPSRLRDRGVQGLLLLALLLEVFAWFSLEGYNLADTVEYLDLSRILVQDGGLEPNVVRMRSPAFPLLLSPFFLVWKAAGVEDLRSLAIAVRVAQLFVSLGLVFVTVRVGTLLSGRAGGLVAGLLVAVNPIFLRYCADPLPDPLAGILLGLAVERLLVCGPERGAGRRAWTGGVLLGMASMLSYKVLPLAVALGLAILVRNRWRQRDNSLRIFSGFALPVSLQIGLDRLIYGQWGLSLANYLVYNAVAVLSSLLSRVGLDAEATWVFRFGSKYYGTKPPVSPEGMAERIQHQTPVTWFATSLQEFLVIPVLLLGAVALWRCLRRPRWSTSTVLVMLGVNLVVLANKHDQSFRLWLPALPLVASLCALGWEPLGGAGGTGRTARAHALRRAAGMAILVAALVLGVARFRSAGVRIHGHYWQAVDWLEQAVAGEARPQRFTAAGFAVAYRHSERLELTPLTALHVPAGTEAEQDLLSSMFESLDWLVVSEALLLTRGSIAAFVAQGFSLEAAFFEPGHSPLLGPVYVFRRRAPDAGGRRLLEVVPRTSSEWPESARSFERPITRPGAAGGTELLTLVDYECEELPGSGLLWLTASWATETGLSVDCRLRLRARTADGRELFDWDHLPGFGLHPTAAWKAGEILVEGRLIRSPAKSLHGDDAALLWASVVELDPEGRPLARLRPFDEVRGNDRRGDSEHDGEVEVGPLP